ncbi:hypothetical protein LCGC14_0926700, partial [marine sediment metagenome]
IRIDTDLPVIKAQVVLIHIIGTLAVRRFRGLFVEPALIHPPDANPVLLINSNLSLILLVPPAIFFSLYKCGGIAPAILLKPTD